MTDDALLALADSWDRSAQHMENECQHKPCTHSHGYRQAAYELRQALSRNGSGA